MLTYITEGEARTLILAANYISCMQLDKKRSMLSLIRLLKLEGSSI